MCGLGGNRPTGRMPLRGKRLRLFCVCFGCATPPKEKFFSFEGVFSVGGGVHGGGNVAEAAQGGGTATMLGGMTPPPSVLEATAEWVRQYATKGGRPGKQTKRGPEVVVVELDAPAPERGKGPTPSLKPSPKPSNVAKVAAQPPPEALDVEALGASVAIQVGR